MEELVVFTKKEFNSLLIKFVENLKEDWQKGYGNKIISRDSGKDISSCTNTIIGSMLPSWNKTIEEMRKND